MHDELSSPSKMKPTILRRVRRRIPLTVTTVFQALLLTSASIVSISAQATDLTWFDGVALRSQAHAVISELRSSASHGLDPRRYALDLPDTQVQQVLAGDAMDSALRERFDAALAKAVSMFLADLHDGRIDPSAAGFHLSRTKGAFDAAQAARLLAHAADVRAAIAAHEPSVLPYRRLKEALTRYRELAEGHDFASLPAPSPRSLREGDAYDGVIPLRTLLRALGDLEPGACTEATTTFDACLSEGVRRFQKRHGLTEDGIIGPKTFAELNVPLPRRVRQIELTMERWRWVSAMPKPDIVVNVPQFVLYALPRSRFGETSAMEMRVIVGQSGPNMRTPVFAEEIEYVVFQPFWDVPASITRRELLPLIRKDPSYLTRNDMEIVRGWSDSAKAIEPTEEVLDQLAAGQLRLRQRPGAKNALGSIKFIMPNPHNVYLHATPNVDLFERSRRAFSHGCIRVSQPAQLAEYVLKSAQGEWSAETIEAALCDPVTKRVDLTTPVPVLIFYGTAVVSEADGILFFEDIYGHDARLDQLLRKAQAKPETARKTSADFANRPRTVAE
jgi:murein L,D-transpeptidase YcbB/YkuD